MDPITIKVMANFLIPTALGCFSYALATLCAYTVSRVPRHVYIGRLGFLGAFMLVVWFFYFPMTTPAYAFSGSRQMWLEQYNPEARAVQRSATFHGMHTTWIWCILAASKRRDVPDDAAAHPEKEEEGRRRDAIQNRNA